MVYKVSILHTSDMYIDIYLIVVQLPIFRYQTCHGFECAYLYSIHARYAMSDSFTLLLCALNVYSITYRINAKSDD